MRLFITDVTNELGIYAVKLTKNGEAKEVVIDEIRSYGDILTKYDFY